MRGLRLPLLILNLAIVAGTGCMLFGIPHFVRPSSRQTREAVEAEIRRTTEARSLRRLALTADSDYRWFDDVVIAYSNFIRAMTWILLACSVAGLVLLCWPEKKT